MKNWMSIRELARDTGLSEVFLRRGVKCGTIPHLKSGCKVLLNRAQVLERLAALAAEEEGAK